MTEQGRDDTRASGDAFELLSDPLRRRAVAELLESETPTETEALVTSVTASDARFPVDADAEEVAIRLRHRDLPKLADANWITYDADGRRIEAHGDEIRAALRAVAADVGDLLDGFEGDGENRDDCTARR